MTTIAELGSFLAREQAAAEGSTLPNTAPAVAPATNGAVAR
jgi:hypothetical protein